MSRPISIRCHNQLNDFLPVQQRANTLKIASKNTRSAKDLIESIGIPHTEIDIIIDNGSSISLTDQVQPGDSIEVYPVFASIGRYTSTQTIIHCQPEPLPDSRFILDVHLGKLAAYLRMLGFDTLYRNDYDDPILADISARQKRILLTCDRKLLMRKQVINGYFVRSRNPQQQILEILERYQLYEKIIPFSRCMHCNGVTHKVSKESIESSLLAKTRKYYTEFYQCETCKKIYWQGSHYSHMKHLIEKWASDQYK